MKKIHLFIASICFSCFFSCSNELDLLPLDRVTADTFYKTRGDFDGAIFASYSSIQDFWATSTETLGERGEFWKITMVITDDAAADVALSDPITQTMDILQITSADVPFQAIYVELYEGIQRANLVLENMEGENELTAEDKALLGAEAKFLRAWFHFQALKLFGPAPLALAVGKELDNLALPNSTVDDLYTAILADFAEAAAGLPAAWDSGNTGRVTSWAAKAYIGKVNVFKGDYPTAITAFEDVIANGPYQLLPDYESVFAFNNENNAESIFEIQFGGPFSDDNIWVFDDNHSENFKASQGIARGLYWDAANGAPGGAQGWFVPSQDLVDAIEPGDLRAPSLFYEDGDTYYASLNGGASTSTAYDPTWSSNGLTLKKYRGEINVAGANHSGNGVADFNNERWFRFAELKLLYAEALLFGGGAAGIAEQQINDIRERAGLPVLAGGADLVAAMMQEKRIELAFEPHRWFDIVRWDLGPTIFGEAWDDKLNLFPFPLSEIDRSNGLMNQNPGYGG